VPKHQYLFIETWSRWQVEVLQGEFGLCIDGPTYFYDPGQQALSSTGWFRDYKLSANRSFLALWGHGFSLHGGRCGGIGSGLTGIYSLPSPASPYFELLTIAPDGTATVHFRGQLLTLAPGESWQTVTEPEIKWFGDALIKEYFVHSVTNFGFWPKRKLFLGDQGWSEITRVVQEAGDNVYREKQVHADRLELVVFNLRGQKVLSLSGNYWEVMEKAEQAVWSRRLPLANGIYLCVVTIITEDGRVLKSKVKKLVILR